jgi:hypothetical protein
MEAQDVDALREMFSTGAHALAIGTDPNEWWTGSDGLGVWIVQIREASGFRFQASKPTAYCVGPVGWVADEPLVTIGNGVEVRVRVTAVLVIERGHWRIAQWHASIAQTNDGFAGLPIRIRAGLHSGEAIKHDDDFYGRTVTIAARISALALGGEVLASDLVYALARGLGTFKFGDPRTATLKGIDGSFDLHPVLG